MISLERLLACVGHITRANCSALRVSSAILVLILGFGCCQAAPAIRDCPPGQVRIAGSCVPIPHRDREHSGPAPSAPASAPAEIESAPAVTAPAARPTNRIVENGYEFLYAKGSERPGFGLYSYVLLTPSSPERTKAILRAIFALTPHATAFGADIAQVNVIYIPLTRDTQQGAVAAANADNATARYNFDLARALIQSICQAPKIGSRVQSCQGGLSAGPYLFSYVSPLGDAANLAPPVLFVDLTDYQEGAFPTIVDAYKAQVKRQDISDRKEIDAFSIKLLSALETAAAWANPIGHAIGDVMQIVKP